MILHDFRRVESPYSGVTLDCIPFQSYVGRDMLSESEPSFLQADPFTSLANHQMVENIDIE